MDEIDEILVEVAYALPQVQHLISVRLPAGGRALDAIRLSGLAQRYPDLDPGGRNKLGIFGKLIDPDQPLAAGDRVEIYRPLVADPKEVRRRLAAQGKTMGRRGRC